MTTTLRLFVVASIVGLLALSSHLLPELFKPKEVRLPTWALEDFPYQLDSWSGVTVELEEEIREELLKDADEQISRAYVNEEELSCSLHLAIFQDLDAGVRHSPINCYRSKGGREIARETMELRLQDGLTIPVILTTWDIAGEQLLIMHWYQIGEHILFGRMDLMKTRLLMRGKPVWPAMLKVLITTKVNNNDPKKSRECIEAFARITHKQITQPGDTSKSPGDSGGTLSPSDSPAAADAL